MLLLWVIFLLFLHGITSKVLQIVWMVPSIHPDYNISTSVGPLAMALKRVKDEQSLSYYDDFNITWLDSECNSQQSIGRLTEFLISRDHVDVILGPPCSNAMVPVANLAGYYNIPVFTWMSRDHILDDKSTFSTLVRTRPAITSLVYMFYAISEQFNWSRAAILYTDDVPSTKTLARAVITKFTEDKEYSLVNQYIVSSSTSKEELHTIFESIERNARILFILIPRSELRRYMLAFHDYGMTGGDYQFLFTEMDLAELSVLSSGSLWRGDDGRDDESRIAFGSLLYFTFTYVIDADEKWSGVTEAYEEMFPNSTLPDPISPDRHSTFLYDAVVLYAAALNETITTKKTSNGTEIFKAVQFKTFTGMSGEVFMNDVSDRFPSFAVWDLAADGTFQMVLSLNYTPGPPFSDIKYNRTVVQYKNIMWGDGRTSSEYIPPDIPVCGFFNELCPTDKTLAVVLTTTISIAVTITVIAGVFIIRWWIRERELYQMAWNIPYAELHFNFRKDKKKSRSNISSMGSDSTSTHADISAMDTHSSMFGSFGSIMGGVSLFDIKISLARYRSTIVVVKSIRKDEIRLDRQLLTHMRELFSLKHPNLATLIGMCTETDKINVLWEYCSKGSLQNSVLEHGHSVISNALIKLLVKDLIDNSERVKLDGAFQFSIANDICIGLAYLHGGPIKYHGNIKSTNCVIDSHWACKLTDFGMAPMRNGQSEEEGLKESERYSRLFWMAPELLRYHLSQMPYTFTQQADIFSLGIVLKELLCLNRPYAGQYNLTAKEIVQFVARPIDHIKQLMRPTIQDVQDDYASIRNSFKRLIYNCWAEDPANRPTIKNVVHTIKQLNPYKSASVLDNMFMMMERYSNRLEEVVSALDDEKKKTEALLYKMLPKTVADELMLGNHVKAEYYDAVTVYFADIVGFTSLAADSTPMQIVDFLNSLYSLFDDIIQRYDVYKVETIGDAYMVASGLPVRNGEKHVTEMADVSLTLLQCVLGYSIPHKPGRQLQIRIGLQTGPAVAGVVGLTMPRYCLFGDTINTASRMESNGRPLLVHITPDTQKILSRNPQYRILERGPVHIKGKGLMETFWLVGKRGLFEIPDEIIQEQVNMASNSDDFKRATRDNPHDNVSNVETINIQPEKSKPLTRRGHHSMCTTHS